MDILNKEELDNLDKLVKVSVDIYNSYSNLFLLEYSGMKNSNQYESEVDKLKLLLIKENDSYIYFNDYNKACKLKNFIFKDNSKNFEDYVMEILYGGNKDFIRDRIERKLDDIIINAEFENDPDSLDMELKYYVGLENSLEEDFVNTILKLLEEYMVDERYKDINYKIFEYKYLLSFIFESVENNFIINDFEVDKDLYWGSLLAADMTFGYDLLDDLRFDFLTIIENRKRDLLDNMEKEELDDLDREEILISQLIIRVVLMFLEDNEKNVFSTQLLNDLAYLKATKKYNSEVFDLIFEIYEKNIFDREKPKILSISGRKK